ncbi:phage virion morphogenesis protein [Paracoccus jiaweipingae]|uniref:phage virion morphogenesis protein n=1 Tax=Paracoccus sp. p2-l61 TaxID=3366950 RepID=UPI0037968A6E
MDARAEFRDGDLRAQLKAAQRAAADMTPLMEDIGLALETSARTRIAETNVSPDGVAWPKSFRVETAQGGKTLFDTGRLRDSITHIAGPGEVEIGTNLIYAAVHQFGATITAKSAGGLFFRLADGTEVLVGSVTIPARPYLGISAQDEQLISADLVPAWWAEVLA